MKDKIIKILNDKMYAYDAVHEWNQPVIMGYDSAAEAISKLIPRWIPVSEKLPEDGEIVLTNTKALGLSINTYRARDKERYMLYVLGWIPGSDLLKLPKEPHWEWEWYSEYGSEVHPCESLEDGKAKAQEDWNNRISQYLTEYREGE